MIKFIHQKKGAHVEFSKLMSQKHLKHNILEIFKDVQIILAMSNHVWLSFYRKMLALYLLCCKS